MPDPIIWSHSAPYLIAALLFGYLLGSIPFGVILARAFGAGDLRKVGSGNIGATNVLRTGRKDLAAGTLVGDLLKDTFAVWIAGIYGSEAALMAGFGAFIGHCFPVWLKFKGGKGVATYIGILLGFSWILMVVFAIIWLLVALISRYSSLSALIGSIATPMSAYFGGAILQLSFSNVQLAELLAILTIILWIRHRENIKRLLSGNESKIGNKS